MSGIILSNSEIQEVKRRAETQFNWANTSVLSLIATIESLQNKNSKILDALKNISAELLDNCDNGDGKEYNGQPCECWYCDRRKDIDKIISECDLPYQIGDKVIARKFIYGYKNATIKDIKDWNGVIAYLCDFEVIPGSENDSEEYSSWIESKDIKSKREGAA
jgi:hypothetical protein